MAVEDAGSDGPPRRLRILCHQHYAWPLQRGGSEVAMHRVLAWLAARGHEVRSLVIRTRGVPVDGVRYARRTDEGQHDWWAWADVALTHQAASKPAVQFSAEHGDVPVVHWAHNWWWHALHGHRVRPGIDVVAWNSHALANHDVGWRGDSLVLRPPVFVDEYPRVTDGRFVTQVNLSELKGGRLFWRLANTMSPREFLAVCGGWGPQVLPDGGEVRDKNAYKPLSQMAPDNVTVSPTSTDMVAEIYARTRVLIAPTEHVNEHQFGESWGMTAVEAAASGIPVISTRSPGACEAMGDAAIWCDPLNDDEWLEAIESLDDPAEYQRRSDAGIDQVRSLGTDADLHHLEQILLDIA